MGKEGIKGLYKGNLTGVIMASSNAYIKSDLYSRVGNAGILTEGYKTNLLSKIFRYWAFSHRNLYFDWSDYFASYDCTIQACPST